MIGSLPQTPAAGQSLCEDKAGTQELSVSLPLGWQQGNDLNHNSLPLRVHIISSRAGARTLALRQEIQASQVLYNLPSQWLPLHQLGKILHDVKQWTQAISMKQAFIEQLLVRESLKLTSQKPVVIMLLEYCAMWIV